jgi:hypothetical protein
MWKDRKFKGLSEKGKYAFVLLLTCPQTGPIPGLFYAGRATLTEELGWEVSEFDKVFKELEELGMARADFTERLVWLPNALKHNRPESPSELRSWVSAYKQFPECGLLDEAFEAIKAYIYGMGEEYKAAFDEAFGAQEIEEEEACEY